MDLTRIYDKLEAVDQKLDEYIKADSEYKIAKGERLARIEEKQKSQEGSIKLLFSLVTAVVTGVVGYISNLVFGK